MNFRALIAAIRRSWFLVCGSALLGAAVAAGLSSLSSPVYKSTAQLFIAVTARSTDKRDTKSVYTSALFAQQRARSYALIVDSPRVLDPVIKDLGMQATSAELGEQLHAAHISGTVLINVSARAAEPMQATAIANAVADSLCKEIVRLETPQGAASSPVKPSVVRRASPASSPIEPRTKNNVLFGGLLGLIIGGVIAIFRIVLDTSVKSGEDLASVTGSTLIGTVDFDPAAARSPLVSLEQNSMRSEGFRRIRTNLRYVDIDNPPRSVVITSSVAGEGKSSSAANLAITMALSGVRVLLVEADLRRPRLADYFGIAGEFGLTNILIGDRTFEQVVTSWNRELLHIVTSGPIPPNPSELLGSQQMYRLLESLYEKYDIVLLDSPPLLPVIDAAVLSCLADGAILVCRYGSTRREQIKQSAAILRQVDARILGTMLNFTPVRRSRRHKGGYGYGYGYGYGAKVSGHSMQQAESAISSSKQKRGALISAATIRRRTERLPRSGGSDGPESGQSACQP